MTTTPPASDRPFGADTDEAVSALLDGELAAFAADHGLSEPDARARLEAWAGLDDRRAELAGARDAVATPGPELDEVTRRRLLQSALNVQAATTASPRRSRVWAVVGAAAAALVVVVGVGLAINAADDGGNGSSDSAASGDTVAADLRGDIGYVGDLSRPDALRDLLTGKRYAASAAEGTRDSAATSDAGSVPAPASGDDQVQRAAPQSPEQCAEQLAGTRPVTFVGTGTYRGTAVTVIGLTEGGRVIAFVVPSDDCTTVLTSVSR